MIPPPPIFLIIPDNQWWCITMHLPWIGLPVGVGGAAHAFESLHTLIYLQVILFIFSSTTKLIKVNSMKSFEIYFGCFPTSLSRLISLPLTWQDVQICSFQFSLNFQTHGTAGYKPGWKRFHLDWHILIPGIGLKYYINLSKRCSDMPNIPWM